MRPSRPVSRSPYGSRPSALPASTSPTASAASCPRGRLRTSRRRRPDRPGRRRRRSTAVRPRASFERGERSGSRKPRSLRGRRPRLRAPRRGRAGAPQAGPLPLPPTEPEVRVVALGEDPAVAARDDAELEHRAAAVALAEPLVGRRSPRARRPTAWFPPSPSARAQMPLTPSAPTRVSACRRSPPQ